MLNYDAVLIYLWGHVSYFIKDFFLYLIILVCATGFSFVSIIKVYTSQASNTKKNTLLLLIFTILSFIYAYSFFEGYFRYRFDQSDSLGFLRVSERWISRHVVYNNYQYRDKNFTVDKEPGKIRIGVMGDSSGFGYGIKNVKNRFSDLLENKLKSNGYNTEVYNFAVSGFDTEQEIKEYQRVKQFNFDILVWEYFLNDIEEENKSAGTKVLKNAQAVPPGIISFLSKYSFFFDYVYWRLDARYEKTFIKIRNADMSQYNDPEIFKHHTDIIDSFTHSLENDNKKIVTVILPFFYFFPQYPEAAVDIHKRMDKVFTDNGVFAVIDILDYVKGKNKQDLIVSPYDSHPNEYVNSIIADKLYDVIVQLISKTEDGKTILKE